MKKLHTLFLILLIAIQAIANIPQDYYLKANGLKSMELKQALKDIILKHKELSYEKLWDYYPYTYYVTNNESQVLDMYSSSTYFFSDHSSMDKEHVVPKSWWGGSVKEGPGCDLFNVIPADHVANVAKSNYSLGVVRGQVSFDNSVVKVGSSGTIGFFGTVFEPSDEYKGDFARIYFYVATCYQDIEWDLFESDAFTWPEEQTLKNWIIPMLLSWNENDPVSEAEITRNENIFKYQENRNPFIDYPELADYIWGEKSDEEFNFSEHKALEGISNNNMKILMPSFSIDYGKKENPKKINKATKLTISSTTPDSYLYTNINDTGWQETSPSSNSIAKITITISDSTFIKAYCSLDGYANSDTCFAYYKEVDFSKDYLLYEAFDEISKGGNTSTSSSSSLWNGNENFPIIDKVYSAGNALRMGTASQPGYITSKKINTLGGDIIVEFDVKGWTEVEGGLKVEITGNQAKIVNYSSTMKDDFEHIILEFSDVSPYPTLSISTTNKRAFIDNIIITQKGSKN